MGPKAKALEKAAENAAAKDRKSAAEAEAAAAAAWSVGAKDNKKEAAAAAAEAERLRKLADKAAALAADEELLGGVAKAKVAKKKGKDDVDMLNAVLAAAPKTKAQKEAEEKKKAAEQQKKLEEEKRLAKEARLAAEAEEIKKAAARGIVLNHADELMTHTRAVNRLDDEDEISATGLAGALDAMSGLGKAGGGGKGSEGQKALYNAYYERELPLLRESNPGLKLSQLKERIFEAWGRSAENPRNQKPAAGGARTFFDEEGGADGEAGAEGGV